MRAISGGCGQTRLRVSMLIRLGGAGAGSEFLAFLSAAAIGSTARSASAAIVRLILLAPRARALQVQTIGMAGLAEVHVVRLVLHQQSRLGRGMRLVATGAAYGRHNLIGGRVDHILHRM